MAADRKFFCPPCLLIYGVVGLVFLGYEYGPDAWRSMATAVAQDTGATREAPEADGIEDSFERVQRQNAVDVEEAYNLADLRIPRGEIHELLPKDAIPALTDPKLEAVTAAGWLKPDDRVVVLAMGKPAIAVPLRILDWHEVANLTVGDEAVAATYCPLCDSATVVSRVVKRPTDDGSAKEVLAFGVSGALYNSNVLMYDRTDKALWSQLGMEAVSGPLAGTSLKHYPVEIVTFAAFEKAHPRGKVVSKDTGHQRNYGKSPYTAYFKNERLLVPVRDVGDALPKKTLGVGVRLGDRAWFVPKQVIGARYKLETPAGMVTMTSGDAGVAVLSAPEGVQTAQTFYYSWSAFHPETEVVQVNDTDRR